MMRRVLSTYKGMSLLVENENLFVIVIDNSTIISTNDIDMIMDIWGDFIVRAGEE